MPMPYSLHFITNVRMGYVVCFLRLWACEGHNTRQSR